MKPSQPNKLPTWLAQPTTPVPRAPRHQVNFLARNQRHVQALLARLAQPAPVPRATHWQLTPPMRLLQLGLMLLVISLVHSPVGLWLLALLIGGQLLLLSPSQLRRFIVSWALSSLLALSFIWPSYWLAGPSTLLLFWGKSSLLLANAQYYRVTTALTDFLTALKAWHCPDVIVMTFAIALTYLRMLGNYLLQTMAALDMRTVAPTKHPYRLIGSLFGQLYLKSYAYALELYAAMEARGFNGHYVTVPTTHVRWRDYLVVSPYVGVLLVLILRGV
ncbi:energy-coupling factor transporter transmembrane component T [Lactiplantibacillus fabifermentans]|uniref:Cobalt transporter n=2 Tax=Lactiplantibacillus fabifermentans TaxID=483011 RepID=A0A0R2NNG8_9LACO|nr:energy-coupling factor transporter transmembrane component T [Lactiplantibacillus fabifermentans]ETY75545.1 cobalt ABC transporter permease [Lactiplantibacillus fabifermentans T30PCM01]KRO26386.1 cobalt transporter [Lactiplantibacillus fabifermentans DSM 21115]